jgi:hypothetical protein
VQHRVVEMSRELAVRKDRRGAFDAVDALGIVAKRTAGAYRPGYRGWIKVKNPAYSAQGARKRVHAAFA